MFLELNLRLGDSTVFFGKPRWTFSGEVVKRDAIVKLLSGKRCCVLVHGYNVKRADSSYAKLYKGILHVYDHVIGVKWPGSEFALAFWLASIRAKVAGRKLAEEISTIPAMWDAEGHSLGCKVCLEAALHMKFRHIVLTAPAVDNESIQVGHRYAKAQADLILVCYSKDDPVLAGAYRLAKLDNALGLTGPEDLAKIPEHVRTADFSGIIDGHNDYKDSREFLTVWEKLVHAS
ncbi:MAG: hypothetical protein N3E46_10175 [Gemmataceae bacterium]|nr:hypothetical protein [Gemmataceae bacterium]